MKLLFTILGTLVVTLMLYMTVRFYGLGQRFQAYDHPFLSLQTPQLIVKVESEKEAAEAVSLDKNTILWLNVRMSVDEKLFVQTKGLLEPYLTFSKLGPDRYHGDHPYFYAFDDLKIYFPNLSEVRTYLQNFPQQKFILNIQDNAQNIHKAVIQLLSETKSDSRVLIQSDIDVVIKSIKEEKANWLFGTSVPELNRVLSLESIGLEMSTAIQSDVWISPLKIKNRSVFNESILNEIKRRQKKVFLGPLLNSEQIFDAQRYKIDGLIIDNLQLFKQFLSPAKSL